VGDDRALLWTRRVRDLAHALASERDPERLLPAILDAAIEITGAERGFLVRVEGRKASGGYRFRVEVARGFDREALAGAAGAVSRTVVRRVVEGEGRGLVTTRPDDEDLLEVSSVKARRVRSILCVPMMLRGEVRGAVYLDHRFAEAAFAAGDLPLMQTFADQGALVLETAELRGRLAAGEERLGDALRELERLERARPPAAPAGAPAASGAERLRFGALVGVSPAMARLYRDLEQAARTWDPVLVSGEAGAGKALVAEELHRRGSFPRQPLRVLACDGVDAATLERDLLGDGERPGALVRAGRGTVVLDEVTALPPALQRALMGVLRGRRVERADGRSDEVEARLVATSRFDPKERVAAGAFREDLFYRLDVLRLRIPPLRERPEDAPLLFAHFAERSGRTPPPRLTPEAEAALAAYAWPGNVRELSNEARRVVAAGLAVVGPEDLSPEVRGAAAAPPPELAGRTLEQVERSAVEAALQATGGNKAEAARRLGVPRSTLYRLIERHGLG